MKHLNKLLLIVMAVCLCSIAEAQESDRKIKIKVKKEINGETKTIEKIYNSIEEMKNDPDLKNVNLDVNGGNTFFFSNDENSTIDIAIDGLKDGESDKNHFFFKVDGDEDFQWSEGEHNIEVIKDEDGNVTVLRNGEPIEKKDNVSVFKYNVDFADSIEDIKIHKIDGGKKVVIINGEKEMEWKTTDDDEIEENVEVIINSLKDVKDAEGKEVKTVKIFVHKVKIQIEDIDKSDEALKGLNLNKKPLKLNDLNYYPNPTDGEFNLSFQGKSVPTEVRITDLSGKMVFSDVISNFSGQYNDDIDLNNEAKGIYIMQIIQGGKALNKKIIIE